MDCTSPIRGYRGAGGRVSPSHKDLNYDLHAEIRCGQCLSCRLEKTRQWAVRIMHETMVHEENSYLTLTYEDQHLPHRSTLNVRDWQLFAKRTRKKLGPFRYFHAGEYGEDKGRPHYHAIVFGLDFSNDRQEIDHDGDYPLWSSDTLNELWGMGNCVIGNVTFESASYVANYCIKKVNGQQADQHYERVCEETGEVYKLKPEYATMSRRPGIGATFLEKYGNQIYPRDEVVMRGVQMKPPAYYDKRVAEIYPDMIDTIKRSRRKEAIKKQEPQTEERRETKNKVRTARHNLYKRKL